MNEINQLELIESDFTKHLEAGSIKGAMKSHGASSKDLWIVDPKILRRLPGFNVRVFNDSLKSKVRQYADSMKANGWRINSVLSGFVAVENGEQVIYVTDGHTRQDALELANSEGAEINQVPILINLKGTSNDDLNVALIQANEANPLSTYEKAIVCKRLLNAGLTEDEISRRTGVKQPFLGQLLKLMAAPNQLKQLVAFEKVSATFAIEMIEKHGAGAADVLLAAVEKAEDSGKVKATKKHVEGAALKKFIHKSSPVMFSVIKEIEQCKAYETLPEEIKLKISELLLQAESKNA